MQFGNWIGIDLVRIGHCLVLALCRSELPKHAKRNTPFPNVPPLQVEYWGKVLCNLHLCAFEGPILEAAQNTLPKELARCPENSAEPRPPTHVATRAIRELWLSHGTSRAMRRGFFKWQGVPTQITRLHHLAAAEPKESLVGIVFLKGNQLSLLEI